MIKLTKEQAEELVLEECVDVNSTLFEVKSYHFVDNTKDGTLHKFILTDGKNDYEFCYGLTKNKLELFFIDSALIRPL